MLQLVILVATIERRAMWQSHPHLVRVPNENSGMATRTKRYNSRLISDNKRIALKIKYTTLKYESETKAIQFVHIARKIIYNSTTLR